MNNGVIDTHGLHVYGQWQLISLVNRALEISRAAMTSDLQEEGIPEITRTHSQRTTKRDGKPNAFNAMLRRQKDSWQQTRSRSCVACRD